MRILVVLAIAVALSLPGSPAQVPPLPEGPQTRWEIGGTDEIAVQLLFDTAPFVERLPNDLRFATRTDVADKWPEAHAYLTAHPEQARYGVSVLEIAHQDHFSIDGREPEWGENGAAGLWFARVISNGPLHEQARGDEHAWLFHLIPDRAYVEYMNGKGHYAAYGEVTLRRDESGVRHGTIQTADLRVNAACSPLGELRTAGPSFQTLYPPRGTTNMFLVLAFDGNRDGECRGTWNIAGANPLATAVVVGAPVFACCGRFLGGAYRMPVRK
jgi:hypothetical protein